MSPASAQQGSDATRAGVTGGAPYVWRLAQNQVSVDATFQPRAEWPAAQFGLGAIGAVHADPYNGHA
ncbi:MAG: hypothetical protein JNK75_09805 [Betaproteobacteria bacterium]|nr:hypothetical protein [Betaproteobacteria bacterium]